MSVKRAARKRKEVPDLEREFMESYKKNFNLNNLKLKKHFPFTDNQTRCYYTINDNNTNMMFIDGLAGSNKAQPLSEPIPTPNGWVTMGDLSVGDDVFSVNGNPTKITGIFPQGEKNIYNVMFSDGSSTRCCGDHLWNTTSYSNRNKWKTKREGGKRIKIKKLEDVYNTLTTDEIRNSLYHKGKINHMIPIITNPVSYNKKELPIDPYAFGLLLGDGSFRTTPIRITTSDDEILNYLKNLYGDNLKHLQSYDYRILGLTDIIKNMGLYKLYSHEKFIPDIYKLSSIHDRINLLQGILDSDGCATKSGSVIFTSASKQLTLDVLEIVNSLGGIAHMSSRSGMLNEIEYKICYRLCINLPSDILPFKLTRKLQRYTPNTKYSPKRYIVSVEPAGVEQCQCIMVEHDSHLYLTKNYIVTHNTYMSVYAALEHLKEGKCEQIIYIRSVVESSSRSLGALPGELDEKFGPYTLPLMDKLAEIVDETSTHALFNQKYIKAIPVNFVRGLTFHDSFVIIDEAQNLTRGELATILTRFGRNSKYIICGDAKQSDIKDSGFEKVFQLFNTEHSIKNNIHCFKFDVDDVVRSPLLKHITQVLGV